MAEWGKSDTVWEGMRDWLPGPWLSPRARGGRGVRMGDGGGCHSAVKSSCCMCAVIVVLIPLMDERDTMSHHSMASHAKVIHPET
jgi:hypothetical protein